MNALAQGVYFKTVSLRILERPCLLDKERDLLQRQDSKNHATIRLLGTGRSKCSRATELGEFTVIRHLVGECTASDPPEKYDMS